MNGIWCITEHDGNLIVGSGDGKIKKLVGAETKWVLESEVLLKGAVKSLSSDPYSNELLAGTSVGNIYRVFP